MNFSIKEGIFDNLFAFFGTLDLHGRILSLRGNLILDLSMNSPTLIGKKFLQAIRRQIQDLKVDELREIISTAAFKESKIHLSLINTRKQSVFVQLYLCPIFDEINETKHIFFCATEITGEIQQKLIRADEKIDTEKSLEIEKLARDEEFFVAFVSHELRSPLNTILGWSKILLTKEVNDTLRKSALETIEKNARLQAKLIDDLVDSVRISSEKFRLQLMEINLYEIAKSVCESQRPAAEKKGVDLEFTFDNENVLVSADPDRLRQIITILISNALDETNSGGLIKIFLETKGHETKIVVKDSGQGIKPEFLPDVFDQFRHKGAGKPLKGNALSLSTLKILTEKHNGRVRAESEGIGFGSTFTIVLPLIDSQVKSEYPARHTMHIHSDV